MEQKDYILREIEHIGAIMNSIRQKVFRGKGNQAITIERQIENVKGQLLTEINFDLERFLNMNLNDSNKYILSFEGFCIKNIELFAECLADVGFSNSCKNSKKYLEKALQLFNLCNSESRTYSLERENNIQAIKSILQP